MNKFLKLSIISIIFTLTINAEIKEVLTDGPFKGIDISSLEIKHAKAIREANKDFKLAVSGYKPKYAKFKKDTPIFADGGSLTYTGYGYKIEVLKSLSSFGNIDGYVYGPILTFSEKIATGNTKVISCTRFYAVKELQKLLKK